MLIIDLRIILCKTSTYEDLPSFLSHESFILEIKQVFDIRVFKAGAKRDLKTPINTLEGVMDVVSELYLRMSSRKTGVTWDPKTWVSISCCVLGCSTILHTKLTLKTLYFKRSMPIVEPICVKEKTELQKQFLLKLLKQNLGECEILAHKYVGYSNVVVV